MKHYLAPQDKVYAVDEGQEFLIQADWTPITDAELQSILDRINKPTPEQVEESRFSAYQAEADPLFFKYQRGEVTEQEWLDKVAEIKARYPKSQ